ncbi:wd repeat and hmg-box dna-binding protein partial [Nannochloropsis oceanica]
MTGSAGFGVEKGASSEAGAAMPPSSSHAKEESLALKELLPEGSRMTMAPATRKNAVTLWACSPNGEMKVIDPLTGALATNPNTQEAVELTAVEGTPTCLALAHGQTALAIGMESGKVEYNSVTWGEGSVPEFSFEDFLVRCTSAVRDVAFSPTDKWVAVASEDLELRLVEMDGREVSSLRKHDGSVRSVCFDPKEEYLVSLGMDGYAMVWDLATKQCVFSKKVLEKESKHQPGQVVPKAAWKPDGSLLALPGSRQPVLVERGSWKVVTLSATTMAHTAEIGFLAWAPDGQMLSTSGADRRVVVWAAPRSATNALRATQSYVEWKGGNESTQLTVREMFWVGDRKLAVLNHLGALGLQSVPAASTGVFLAAYEEGNGERSTAVDSSPVDKTSMVTKASDSDSDSEAFTPKKSNRFLDDEAASVDGAEGKDGKGDEDLEEEEPAPEDYDADGDRHHRESMADAALMQVPHMQGPFLPSSSPLDATKRYLVWSLVGNIVSQNLGDHNVIEIEFADASRRPIRFTDHYRFIMGSIAEDGAIFASAAFLGADADRREDEEDEEEHSTVFFRPFANYSTKNQWLFTLPKMEGALSVAVGTRWAAVATTRQWVRLFTFSGLQEGMVSFPGPIVTMVGRGDLLAIFYHGGSPLVDPSTGAASQALHYQLLDVRRTTVVGNGPVALSPKSLLTWAGFSNLDILHVMDSEGLVSGLVRGFGWNWTPLLETSRLQRNKMDSFWPVGVLNGSLMCSLLKGGEEHPSTNPKPLVSSLPLKLPLVVSNNDQALQKLEETRLLAKTFLHQKLHQQEILADEGLEEPRLEVELLRDQASYDAHLVKMIQQAGANENGERMLELAEMLTLSKSLALAIRVADHYSLPQVAARISELMAARFPPAYEEDEVENWAPNRTSRAGTGNRAQQQSRSGQGDEDSMSVAEDESENSTGPADDDEAKSPARPQLSRRGIGSSPPFKPGRGKADAAGFGAGGSRNPFAVKKDASGSMPVEKRVRGIAESLGSLVGSPSPKKPVLAKTSTFVSEIRSKKKHDRRA